MTKKIEEKNGGVYLSSLDKVYDRENVEYSILSRKQLKFLLEKRVIQLAPKNLGFKCLECGYIWHIIARSQMQRLPKCYWKCPYCGGEKAFE